MRQNIVRTVVITLALLLVFSMGPVTDSDAGARKAGSAAKKTNPCNPCAAKMNPCAAQQTNPCAAKMNPCNPCAAKAAKGPAAKARMIVGQVIAADANRLAVQWQDQTLQIGVHGKTQYTRGREKTSAASIVPGEQITVSVLDQGGKLDANYVYLAQVKAGNPCNPCAANPCAAKAANPCAAKQMNPCNPCAAKQNPGNPCGAKR